MSVAVVTGGATGLGLLIARGLSDAGYATITVGHGCDHERNLDESADWIDEINESAGPIEVLVNNAGVYMPGEERYAMWKSFVVNTAAPFAAIQRLKDLTCPRPATIVNIASMAYKTHPSQAPAYATSKAALVAMTGSLGRAFAASWPQCRIYAVAPGTVLGTRMEKAVRSGGRPQYTRPQEPGDVVETVRWLCKARPEALSGACIDMPGVPA